MAENNNKKFNKFSWLTLAIFCLSFIFLIFWNMRVPTVKAEFGGENLNLMLAKTIDQQYKGLGGRDDLGKYDGMLFVFLDSERRGFVMRDMRFSIDIIWFQDGEVVDIAHSAPIENVPNDQLKVYYPRKDANMVLEVWAGWAAEKGIKIGDKIKIGA